MLSKCKKFLKAAFFAVMSLFAAENVASAAEGKILFIPHDDRPISYNQTIEVVGQAGLKIIAPPKNLLNNAETMGQPDKLWQWLFENISAVNSAVIASDSLLYGGLIPSRKHEVSQEVLDARLENFEKLRRENPNVKIYIFDSLMRTPSQGTKGDIEEPEYYAEHGANLFQYSVLACKNEISGLTGDEEKIWTETAEKIPTDIFDDWLGRRGKNLDATKKLLKMTADGLIDYLIVGRDDTSPLSQTQREYRQLMAFAKKNNLPKTKFQCLAGIDEFNLLLLTRAINEMRGDVPTVNVQFNKGKGGSTIPAFSDEKISASIDEEIIISGGKKISNPKKADFVLLVNTDENGETIWGHNPYPDGSEFVPKLIPSNSTKNFIELVEKNLAKNYSVGIADINFANGSDNALMTVLHEKDLLFKLQSYSGWNTATNSTGFALSIGILAKKMSAEAKRKILLYRYLDDWIYQANVRTIVGNEIVRKFGDPTFYYALGDKISWAENRNTELMKEFAEKNSLPVGNFQIRNTWQRMFECDIEFN